MKFLCGGCRTKYQISDEKIRGKILTIRCKKCGAKILVREQLTREGGTAVAPIAEDERAANMSLAAEARNVVGAPQLGGSALQSAFDVAMHANDESEDMPTTIAPTPGNLESAGVEWYVAIDGEQSGPFAFAELVRKVQTKEISGRHYVWHDGMDGWKRVREVNDLAAYLGNEKKKPPPPPPGVSGGAEAADAKGGEVVDFASRRKEREQRARPTGDLHSADIVSDTPAHHEGPTEAKVETKAPGREEQLDHVLNEALGIENEGKTAKAGAVAVSATAGVAGEQKHGLDDLAFAGDDIFAHVPRAAQSDIEVKESTRFFVAAAGVNRQKKRNRMGILAGAFGVFLFMAFMISWATGIVAISIPGIGNPFNFSSGEKEREAWVAELDAREAEELKKILDPTERKKRERAILEKKKAARPKVVKNDVPSGEYVTDTPEGGEPRGTRGTDTESIQIDPLAAVGQPGVDVPQARLPESGVENFPAVEHGTLSQDTIGKVINEKKKSVSICYQQSLRGNEELRGKLEFLVMIEPTGLVSKVSVETTAFKGTKLARCIATKINEWRFPPFSGEAQQVQVPFVLEKNSY
jgi:predicted Zn finger-like uncharacterized protein